MRKGEGRCPHLGWLRLALGQPCLGRGPAGKLDRSAPSGEAGVWPQAHSFAHTLGLPHRAQNCNRNKGSVSVGGRGRV